MKLMQPTSFTVGAPPVSGLRPYFICRTAGLPTSSVAQLQSQRTREACSALETLDEALERAREQLGERLYDEVGGIGDKSVRNRIVQLRRDLFNGRLPRVSDLRAGDEALSSELRMALTEHVASLRRRTELTNEFAAVFLSELARTRALLQAAVADDDFRRGLLVSSDTLHRNVERYRRALPHATSSRDGQIERGLLRYFTRTAMKATPFATFCAVIPGRFHPSDGVPDDGSAVRLGGDLRSKRSFVRLNKTLFSMLWAHLKSRPAVRAALVVELTPTLTRQESTLHFLSETEGREVFQRLAANEALDVILPLLRAQSGTRLGALIDALVEDSRIEASPDEAAAYLDQLITLGLLRFRTGIADQDADWDIGVSAFLDPIDDPDAQAAANVLRALRARVGQYADANVDERVRIAAEMRDRITGLTDSWTLPAFASKYIVYHEDATADAEMHVEVDDAMAAAFERFSEWAALVVRVATRRPDQAALRHFFDSRYSAGDRDIPLLQFYEDFYREHFKDHLQRRRDAERGKPPTDTPSYDLANPFSLECVATWHRARAALTELWRTAWARTPNAVEITVSRDDVRASLADMPPLPPEELSLGAFCELVSPPPHSARPARVILKSGQVYTGRGKYFSRFLYMLPDTLRQSVFADNNSEPDEWRAEICADTNFNANLHPPLMKWEISYPTAESGGSDDQLLCSDLLVVPSLRDPHALQLIHGPTGTRVVPFDLGFLNPQMRPPLFQLLSRFTPMADAAVQLPDQLVRANAMADSATVTEQVKVEYRPRMTFEGSVILSRRRWTVPSELFPRQERHEDDATYFLRVQRWRTTHGIPEQVYLRIRPSRAKRLPPEAGMEVIMTPEADHDGLADANADDELADVSPLEIPEQARQPDDDAESVDDHATKRPIARRGGSRDFMKPQFIDFGSPLLVNLFAHAPGPLEHFVMFVEERFPEADELPELDGERYVTELVIQLEMGRTVSPTSEPVPVLVAEYA